MEPKLTSKILPYSIAIIVIIVAVSIMKDGLYFWREWQREYILPALVFIPLMASVTWLRWDWAPYVGAKRRREKAREKP